VTDTFRSILHFVLVLACMSAIGCASFQPVPMDRVPFKKRSVTQSDGNVTVTAVALSAEESKQVFGVDVAERDIQPVWLEIDNREDYPCWVFPVNTDPNYYSPAEVAYLNRLCWSPEENKRMRLYFESLNMTWAIPADSAVSGFIHTRTDPGLKYINVTLWSLHGVKRFRFLVEAPGIKADYQEVDIKKLYSPEDYIECDEERLRAELEKLPCCTTDKDGRRQGDPLNLVFIGDAVDVLTALIGSGWDVTEKLSSGSVWRTARSFLFGKRYRNSPVSRLYVFGRSQDAAFQKARETVSERNHLRVWLTPLRFEGLPVWIGQITRDIGVKLTLSTGFLVTHVIDADVDNDRYYLIQTVADANALARFGYVKGVGPTTPENPRFNLGGDPYYTDGLRAVLQCTKTPVMLTSVQFFDWDWRPSAEPYARAEGRKVLEDEGK